jgi:hypothetical protein
MSPRGRFRMSLDSDNLADLRVAGCVMPRTSAALAQPTAVAAGRLEPRRYAQAMRIRYSIARLRSLVRPT